MHSFKCGKEETAGGDMPVHFKFKMIGEGFKQRFNNDLRKYDLTFSQFGLICYLQNKQDEKVHIKEIGEVFNLTHPTVVGLVNRLEEKGFIETKPDPDNKRYRLVTLTGKGSEIKEEMDRGRDEMEELVLKGFSEEESKELRRLLDKVIDNISDYE